MSVGELGSIWVRYKADVSDLSNKVKSVKSDMASVPAEAQKSGSSISSGFAGGLGSVLHFGSQLGMTVFGLKSVAQGAIGLGEALLEPNASMEQVTTGFQTLLGKGKATQDMMNQLQQFAAATPFEFPELATDAEHMLAFGFSAKEVIPDLTSIGDAMSAMGKSNAEIDSVVTVFGQMKAAGKVNAQDMMQLTSQGIPAWKILAQSMHLTVPEVEALSQKGLLPADKSIKALTGGMEKMFGGGMKAQAQTFNGQLSTVKDNASAALRSFTGPLFDMAKQGLGKLGELVSSPKFQQFAKVLGQDIAGAFSTIGGVIGTVAGGIGTVVGWFQQGSAPAIAVGVALAAIAAGFAAIQVGAFIAAVPALVGGFGAWAGSAWAAAAATIAATWPLFAIGAAVALVVAGIILAVRNWGAITTWLGNLWAAVSGWIGARFSWLGGVAHVVTSAIGGFFSGLGDRIQLWLFAWRLAFSLAGAAFSQFGSFIHGIIDAVGSAFSGLGSRIRGIWDGIVGAIKGAINSIIGAINSFIGAINGIQIHIPSVGIGPIHTPAFDWGGLGIPTIPMLASGGYIVQTGLAMVHAGESVVPATASAGYAAGGSRQPAHFHFEINGREFALATVDDIQAAADQHVRLKMGSRGRSA